MFTYLGILPFILRYRTCDPLYVFFSFILKDKSSHCRNTSDVEKDRPNCNWFRKSNKRRILGKSSENEERVDRRGLSRDLKNYHHYGLPKKDIYEFRMNDLQRILKKKKKRLNWLFLCTLCLLSSRHSVTYLLDIQFRGNFTTCPTDKHSPELQEPMESS